MSGCVLGIDTSNYRTSAALYYPGEDRLIHERKLLPVVKGGLGLRQSDAVFHHTAQLHGVIARLCEKAGDIPPIEAIGVSARPRDVSGSYMPCFTVGMNIAYSLGALLSVPVYEFSHQAGHIAAAVYSSGRHELFDEEFIAFHVSGGTTEAVLAKPDEEHGFSAQIVGRTLDLHAGQAIDRVGVMLGLDFPSGEQLEQLALCCGKSVRVKPCLKGSDCCLSGVENICAKMAENNTSREEIALFCLMYVEQTLEKMCEAIIKEHGGLPVLFAGGVMADSIIRDKLAERFSCGFASPELSGDNACGTAILAARRMNGAEK